MTTTEEFARRRWIALALLCFAQFIVVLDASIVNVALPSIGKGLHFSQANLPWVINAYVLTFGGFLLLGGRLADLLGRRRVFMAGLFVASPFVLYQIWLFISPGLYRHEKRYVFPFMASTLTSVTPLFEVAMSNE